MAERRSRYRITLFDRYGPDAEHIVRAWGYGAMCFGTAFGVTIAKTGDFVWALAAGSALGFLAGTGGYFAGRVAGSAWRRALVDGSSTPYKEQYSFQQALVMQGLLDDALASYEALIAQHPDDADVRIRAAELYDREAKNHARAAELFRQAQRSPALTPGQDIYVSNRLADLYVGPLKDPGKALVALRRLVDRYPNTAAAGPARAAIAEIKSRLIRPD